MRRRLLRLQIQDKRKSSLRFASIKTSSQVDDKIYEAVAKEVNKFKGNKDGNRVIQEVQKTFKCCGLKNYQQDYKNGIPASCCGQTEFNAEYSDVCDQSKVEYTEGCGEKVKNTLNNYLGGLGGVAIALILIQLLIVLSACCLSREVRN